MKRINVILKATKTGTTTSEPIKIDLIEKIELVPNFDFREKFEAFLATREEKIAPERLTKLFYDSLSAEEQLLMRSYSGNLENDDLLAEAVAQLSKHPLVQDAREDSLNELYLIPNDTNYSQLWAMPKINAPKAWDITRGSGTLVAVCDTGIDPKHPDLSSNLWNNGAGHFGFDFSNNDTNPSDYHGHGTHVAGTIAAAGNNQLGVVGVAYEAKVMAVKVFPNAFNSVCAQGIRYAADNGARLINCSWGPGGTGPVSADPTLKAAIDYAFNRGCYCIFSAGNNNIDCSTQFPANYDKVITVASTNTADQRSPFSNFGKVVDIAAPGEDILSLQMTTANYTRMSGTSMAAPHVTGACALILSLASHLSFKNLRYFLQKSADPITTSKPISGLRLNCYRLIAPAPQTVHRQSTVYTNVGRYALHTSGHIAHILYGSAWVQNLIPVSGSPIRPGTFCNMANDRVAAINVVGNMVNTYPWNGAIQYAPIPETFGIVPGTLRFAASRDAYFAANVFHDFVHIKWVNNQWNMDIVPSIATKPILAASVELALAPERPMAINGAGEMVHLWADPNGTVLCDGSKLSYGYLQTSGLVS